MNAKKCAIGVIKRVEDDATSKKGVLSMHLMLNYVICLTAKQI